MTIQWLLLITSGLFCTGIYGVLTRRNAIALLVSAELMANAVSINLVAFGNAAGDITGQLFAIFTIALTVAEVVVGLAIVILLFRWRREIAVDSANEFRR
jgi:NADH-quinone oxidoreductase subunit K